VDTRCIFCSIANGEAGVPLVYENEIMAAFDDASPQAPVHVLVVPKAHYTNLGDEVEPSVLGALLAAVPVVAERKGIAESGYRVIVNTGRHASQTVPHLHVHVMGGRQMGHGMVRFAEQTAGG
jgi:histidine triad (HIT) family protein